jgi:Tfp pilus assembly protein PilV
VLIAVAIMSIAVLGIGGALVTAVHVSDIHRKQATAGALVHSIAEQLQATYTEGICGSNPQNAYSKASQPAAYQALTGHPGYDAMVERVLFWHPAATPAAFGSGCPDVGVQLVTVRVWNGDVEERLDVVLRKLCRPGDPPCA